jgi:tetratricopeptide (TPR) repeat protein
MEKIKWLDEYLKHALEVALLEGHERALKLLDRLLYEEPGYGKLHQILGVVYARYAEDDRLAEQHFRLAIRFNPELPETYSYLAELLQQHDRHDETIEVCVKGLHVKKANKSQLLENIGNAWELKKKYRKAIKSYRDALSHSAELWNCRVLEESIKRCKRKEK